MPKSDQQRLAIDVWSDVMCPFCYMGDGVAIQPGPKLIVELETAPFRGRWLLPEKGVLGERET